MMAEFIGMSYDTMTHGDILYRARCTECHTYQVPKAPTLGRPWHRESLGLSLCQSLSDAERYRLSEYVRGVDRRFYSRNVDPRLEIVQ
jgi:hypothetical protein